MKTYLLSKSANGKFRFMNIYTDEELKLVIQKTKEVGAIVIIDEAYHYFYDKTFLNYALAEENVIILRTFSKLMSQYAHPA